MRPIRRKSGKSLRRDIAHAAARLVVEGEASGFAAAKRKAAAQMGLHDFRSLPDNLEVQSAVIEYQRVFEGDRMDERMDFMRREALTAMGVFERFAPRLVGPVLYGSACEHSPVTLHLHTDELESVTRFLHQRDIRYRLASTSLKTSAKLREDFPVYHVRNKTLDFEIVVLPLSFLAHPPLSSLDGRPYKRADAAALKKLISKTVALDSSAPASDTPEPHGGP